MHINIELNDEYESKLVYVQQKMEQPDVKAVIEAAIELYYNQLEPSPQTALESFRDSGFIGCIQANPDLSANYKEVVRSTMQKRFTRSQEQ